MSKSLKTHEASVFLDSLLHLALSSQTFQIQTCFNVTVPSSWRIEERVLDEIHILYVRSGIVTYQVDGFPVKLSAGCLLFLSDGSLHEAYMDLNEPLSIIPIRFKIRRYEDTNGKFLASSVPCFFSFLPRDTQKFRLLFETIHRHYRLPPSVRRDALCHAAIGQTLAEMSNELEELERSKPIRPAIIHIKNHMDTNPADRLTVKELAAISGLTPKYCSQLFYQMFGLTIKEYQIKTRIDYARYLLEHSDQSVKEIAFHLGYPDPFVFSKQYKSVMGIAPSETLREDRSTGGRSTWI
ncbi:AraC family transcriptional regulator [Paenibacillus sp. PAMC21692]|uniref:helix-turn-helix domain-containing protein n=1 Tax=Paenibacillus sp. PAMC21692 TaxID=2762320 RepID=UPI00164D30AE|nr:AraC family transcriptional regulator [Paenibacillus sp. PAMC21692]QNK57172.1 helix-turn-helix transcriptional regulator [Paenibacillus sp. PAMC21692]